MNLREHYINNILDSIIQSEVPGKLNIIEIGCMFKEDEGLSTYNIARLISRTKENTRFVSIDYDSAHIDSARLLLKKYDGSLIEKIEFKNGDSLKVLPQLLEEMNKVHFAFIDGGGHPEVCLKEFELIIKHLSSNGVCLVDDLQELKPTNNYGALRPFGKGTLIYPFLVISDYLKYRQVNKPAGQQYESELINSLDKTFANDLLVKEFRILNGAGEHGMLAFGNKNIIKNIVEYNTTIANPAGRIYKLCNILNKIKMALRI
jgi:hypothetical protein